eukprot:TRINITY_DN2099_c0_g1_i1.p2 TRINITY_DN2099_c0_g1~~TRINITY_DN2099_c0_g1_i1.p2  ORF type:complete len:188 (-),score=32.73 TRINITY_DN2099_c0_g1_i1:672-1235(-)
MSEAVKNIVVPLPSNWVGKNRYKTGGLTVLMCLAVWSVVSGGAGLAVRLSVGIYPFSDRLTETGVDSLAALLMNDVEDNFDGTAHEIRQSPIAGWELAERANIVLWVWDAYVNDPSRKMSNFWHDAFEAAFEEMESEDQAVKNAAVEEIARLTVNVFDLDDESDKPNPRLFTADLVPRSGQPRLWRV